MTNINVDELIKSCDTIAHRCITIGNGNHGSSWLFDKVMRAFDSHPAIVGVTYEVFINSPVMLPGWVTINRDGSFSMTTHSDFLYGQ